MGPFPSHLHPSTGSRIGRPPGLPERGGSHSRGKGGGITESMIAVSCLGRPIVTGSGHTAADRGSPDKPLPDWVHQGPDQTNRVALPAFDETRTVEGVGIGFAHATRPETLSTAGKRSNSDARMRKASPLCCQGHATLPSSVTQTFGNERRFPTCVLREQEEAQPQARQPAPAVTQSGSNPR